MRPYYRDEKRTHTSESFPGARLGRPIRRSSERSLCLRGALRDDANRVIDNLQEAALDAEAAGLAVRAQLQSALAEQRHHRRVPGQNSDFAVVCGRDDRVDAPLEH